MAVELLSAPFPWFGGKSRVASLVWSRFGNVPNYCEPFFGSGAVLLARPHPPGIETINDLDCFVANFWRALKYDPEGVAKHADWPVNEADLHARHLWLINRVEFRQKMKTDPKFYDSRIAGWWVWGISMWIGGGWCSTAEKPKQQRPHLTSSDGVHSVSKRHPYLTHHGKGTQQKKFSTKLAFQFQVLSNRLRRVRICCGDWSRICTPGSTINNNLTGVFLDPPYSEKANRDKGLYGTDSDTVAIDARKWVLANDSNPLLRIALCGYEGEYEMPPSWECVPWKAAGGYGKPTTRGKVNATKERIWFSPYCLKGGLLNL